MTRHAKCLALLLPLWFHSPLTAATTPTVGISELEGYKRKLQDFESSSDPARVAQLRQMQRLLSLMQHSIAQEQIAPKPEPPAQPATSPVALSPLPAPDPNTAEREPIVSTPVPQPAPMPAPLSPPLSEKQAPAPLVSLTPNLRPLAHTKPETIIPTWFSEVQLSTAIGYQENLLHSAFSKLDSALIRGEAEIQIIDTEREDAQRYLLLARYERTHFLEEPSVRDEDLFFLLGQAEQHLSDAWWLGLQTTYLSAHQPVDDPDLIDLENVSSPLRFEQLSFSPQLTWEPSDQHTWVAQIGHRHERTKGLAIERQDNDQVLAGLTYTYTPSVSHRFQFEYQFSDIDYEERRARDAAGSFLDDTLELRRHEWSASYRRTWELPTSRWRAEARMRWILEDGEPSAYDDLSRLEFRGRLSWRFRKKTEIRAEARYGHYTYDARQVTPEDPSKRERSYWTASLTAEHALNERTAFTLHYDFRENAGNRPVDRYTTQTLYSGIRLTF